MEKKIEVWRGAVLEIGNGILTAYFVVMMAFYPFYIKDGYQEIGNVKYYFFRDVSLIVMGGMVLVALAGLALQEKRSIIRFYENLSATDWFVYGYLICNLVSWLFSSYKKEAFWGAAGWYMGLVSQLIFIGSYFFYSRYFKGNEKLLYIALPGSGLVFLLGILNRYSIYPVAMSGATPTFISTLGNINWFCGYWAVICPLGIFLYWNGRGGWKQAAAGIYVVIAFVSGVTQGSGSAFLALAGMFLLLFALSFRGNQEMYRFLEICILFALACQMARGFRYLPGWEINYENDLSAVLTDSNITLYLGIAAVLFYLLFRRMAKRKDYRIAEHKWIGRTVFLLLIVLFAGYLALLVGNTRLPGRFPHLSGRPAFTFNDMWANYRGATWTDGVLAYQSMSPRYKIIGVGPDCFAEYVYAVPELGMRIYSQFGNSRLTNAHNEWLTVLVNQGVLGAVCYAGIFLSAFIRFLKGGGTKPALYLCAAAVLVYTVHNIVSFQQVLNTPYVFILLGIGERIAKRSG